MAARARSFASHVPPAPSSRPRLGKRVGAVVPAWLEPRLGSANLRIVHVLDGGITRWIGEGRPVTREVVRHAPASFTARVPS